MESPMWVGPSCYLQVMQRFQARQRGQPEQKGTFLVLAFTFWAASSVLPGFGLRGASSHGAGSSVLKFPG